MNTLDLSRKNRKAYDALPEPYRNDDCLEFFYKDGELYAQPADGQSHLGEWSAKFDAKQNKWLNQ